MIGGAFMKKEIENKINSLRKEFPFLAKKDDNYILNAVAVQTIFYKNPNNSLETGTLEKIIVDGTKDGGIDCILNDPDSDESDLILIQCKNKESFPFEEIKAALDKMHGAYLQLVNAKFSQFKDEVVSQYCECQYETTDSAKVRFIICTTAPQSGTKIKSITNYFKSIPDCIFTYLSNSLPTSAVECRGIWNRCCVIGLHHHS